MGIKMLIICKQKNFSDIPNNPVSVLHAIPSKPAVILFCSTEFWIALQLTIWVNNKYAIINMNYVKCWLIIEVLANHHELFIWEITRKIKQTQCVKTKEIQDLLLVKAKWGKPGFQFNDIWTGGHWPRKGVWGCAVVMTPFFQASRRSLAYQFTIIAPLLRPPFSNFRKFFHFQPCFGQNFNSQDVNFPNSVP